MTLPQSSPALETALSLTKLGLEPISSWDGLKFWDSGEYQVIQERLADLDKSDIKWNPGRDNLFRALELCPFDKTKVVIVGQDPYPNPNFATGVAFSIKKTSKVWPPTLTCILNELRTDMAIGAEYGNLEKWCKQGVLLWNVIPTCKSYESGSHYWPEWDGLTKEILQRLSLECVVLRFWGAKAKEWMKYADKNESDVDWVGHPSPRGSAQSARPFTGSRQFSNINAALKKLGHEPIDWRLS